MLILGPSGSGKSALALSLMALGCTLVADDRTIVTAEGDTLIASCPPAIAGMIEARGVGILRAEARPPVPLVLAVDLAQRSTTRLPERRDIRLLDRHLPLICPVDGPQWVPAILQWLKSGWSDQ